jgi:hypothetical protein
MRLLKKLAGVLDSWGLGLEAEEIRKLALDGSSDYLWHETSLESLGEIAREGLLPRSYGQSLVGEGGRILSPEEKMEDIRFWLSEEAELDEEEVLRIFHSEVDEDDLILRTYVHPRLPSFLSYGDILIRFPFRELKKDVDYYILDSIPPEEIEVQVEGGWIPLKEWRGGLHA